MARQGPYGIQLTYDTGAADMVAAYGELVREFGLSKFPQYLGQSLHRIGDKRFNKAMTAAGDEYKHMFEWGTKGTTVGSRLWETFYIKETAMVGYAFLPSKRLVPKADEFTKFRHTFTNKAAAMEEAPVVDIKPVQAKFLRWREGGEEVRSVQGVTRQVAGGVYEGKFQAFFLLFWASGGAGSIEDMAHALKSSSKFRFEINKNRIAGLKRARTGQQKRLKHGSAETKAMAKKRIEEIEREMLKLGVTL